MPCVRQALMIRVLRFSAKTQDKKPSGTILYFMEQTLGSCPAALDAIWRTPPPVSHFMSLPTEQLFDTILQAYLPRQLRTWTETTHGSLHLTMNPKRAFIDKIRTM